MAHYFPPANDARLVSGIMTRTSVSQGEWVIVGPSHRTRAQ